MFTYENSSMLSYKYILFPPDSINVRDFRIINDWLYFCGENTNSKRGVIGVFKLASFFFPVGTNTHFDFFEVSNTTTLFKMVAYMDPATNIPRLAAVGYNRGNNCGVWACGVWVDCEGYAPGASPTSVSVFNSYYGAPSEIEQWNDVVATDDWVVLVGSGYIAGQKGLMLRKFHKGLPSDPELDNLYFYSESEAFVADEVRALTIINNDVAVAYRGIRIDNVTDFTKFRIFDINSMHNINSQEYVVPYKSKINEVAYMELANQVVLINEFPSPVSISNFVYLTPYQTTTYNSVYVRDKTQYYWSVTNLDGNYFVGAGYFHFLLRDASALFPANNNYSSIPSLCPENEDLKVYIIDNINPYLVFYPLPQPPTNLNASGIDSPLWNKLLQIRCYSF